MTVQERLAMALRINTFDLLVLLLLLICSSSSGIAEGFVNNMNPLFSLPKGDVQMNPRKLLVVDTVLDYETGPNPKHDPRKGKPGGGGKNP